MFPRKSTPIDLDGLRGSTESGQPTAKQPQATGARGSASPASGPDGEHTLQTDSASVSADHKGISLWLPAAQVHVGTQITKWVAGPSAAISVEEESLREELLSNDSPGG